MGAHSRRGWRVPDPQPRHARCFQTLRQDIGRLWSLLDNWEPHHPDPDRRKTLIERQQRVTRELWELLDKLPQRTQPRDLLEIRRRVT